MRHMYRNNMRAIIAILLLLSSGVLNAETLKYDVSYKGAFTAFSWANIADASLSTRKQVPCGNAQTCLNSRVRMTSENHKVLESLYPMRFYYQSFFQQNPARTLAFEKREKKSKSKYQPYGYRHKLVTISGDGKSATIHELWSTGEPLASNEKRYVSTDHNGGKPPSVKKRSTSPVATNALDRWAMIYTARFLPYSKGFSQTFPGTTGTHKLTYKVSLEGTERVRARGRDFEAWKVSIVETKAGKRQPTLYMWISADDSRLPVRIEMEEEIGRLRFVLK